MYLLFCILKLLHIWIGKKISAWCEHHRQILKSALRLLSNTDLWFGERHCNNAALVIGTKDNVELKVVHWIFETIIHIRLQNTLAWLTTIKTASKCELFTCTIHLWRVVIMNGCPFLPCFNWYSYCRIREPQEHKTTCKMEQWEAYKEEFWRDSQKWSEPSLLQGLGNWCSLPHLLLKPDQKPAIKSFFKTAQFPKG